MKQFTNKLQKPLLAILILLALILSVQNGFCCQQDGATCQNNGDPQQACCDGENGEEYECWDAINEKVAKDNDVGECKLKENQEEE